MQIKLTKDMAYAIGQDEGNRHMRQHGRKQWDEDDWNVAAQKTNALLDIIEQENCKKE